MFKKMGNKYKYIYTLNKERISGLILLEPKVNYDERGYFLESWNKRDFDCLLTKDNQEKVEFVQENHSKSFQGVLRGLHFQREPYAQGKLVKCASGLIFDVVLDLRQDSKTFSKWAGVFLSSDNLNQLWIPKGFAHGFLTLSSKAEVSYKTTDYWNKEHEMSIFWDDKNINIQWPLEKISSKVITNQKDKYAKNLFKIKKEFLF